MKKDCGSHCAEEQGGQKETLREDISSWQFMVFTVAKLRSGMRTGFIHMCLLVMRIIQQGCGRG